MWETQNDKIGAAVKIQKTVRGNQARRSLDGGRGGGRGRETTVGLLMRTDLTKADDALCAQPPLAVRWPARAEAAAPALQVAGGGDLRDRIAQRRARALSALAPNRG